MIGQRAEKGVLTVKTSIIVSFVFAASLFAPIAANAGEGAVKSLHKQHVAHRHATFVRATALYEPAPRGAATPVFDWGPKGITGSGDTGFSWEPNNW